MNGVIEACKNYLGGGSARDESAGEQTITTGRILSVDERLNAHTYQLQGHDVIFPHANAHLMGKHVPTSNCKQGSLLRLLSGCQTFQEGQIGQVGQCIFSFCEHAFQ